MTTQFEPAALRLSDQLGAAAIVGMSAPVMVGGAYAGQVLPWTAVEPAPTAMLLRPLPVGAQLYDKETVRRMVEGAWCAGYYDAGYTHDSAYAEKMAEKCADEFLGPNRS